MSELRLALFCKSYDRDVTRCRKLQESIQKHVAPAIAFVVCVPDADRALFERTLSAERLLLVTDEQVCGSATVKQSWKSQQVVKLAAHQLDFADVWLLVDSDFYFIRPFGPDDFRGPGGRYRCVVSRHRHHYDPGPVREHVHGRQLIEPLTRQACQAWKASREPNSISKLLRFKDGLRNAVVGGWDPYQRLERIPRLMGREAGPYLVYMPGPCWSRALLQRFDEEFLKPRRLTYETLIRYSPWEANWIGEWILAQGFEALDKTLPMEPCEPLFLHFQSDAAIELARSEGVTEALVAQRYFGLALASGQQSIERF